MAQVNLMGKTILGYTVNEKLGMGAFGTVYKVIKRNPSGEYVRALKHITIPTDKQYTSLLNSMGGDVSKVDNYFVEMLNNIVSEIRILNDLSEKGVSHIVQYYENDIVTTDSPRRYDIFILMEYLTPLEDFIQNHNFCVSDVIKLGQDILCALSSCHENKIIHRDIKDDNIFVSKEGEFKIGDFGVAKILKDSTKAESLKGTPNFLAPEVYLGKGSYTKTVDLYSLGIVLYRLLNYNRNPFLPNFPVQFYSKDEDIAFEKRMSGKIPDLPTLGGEHIGKVIVKAILNKSDRFQTADEFKDALEIAVKNTEKEVLEKSIKLEVSNYSGTISDTQPKTYQETLKESISVLPPEDVVENEKDKEDNHSLVNKYLFESIGEIPPVDRPDVEPAVEVREEDKKKEKGNNSDINSHSVNSVLSQVNISESLSAFDPKMKDKFVFLSPVIILLVGIIFGLMIVPNIIGIFSFIFIEILGWIWLACFITSLFCVGKKLHKKPNPDTEKTILTKRESYLIVQDVSNILKQTKMMKNSKELDNVIYSVKCLEEKLNSESDFGYGDNGIINCENNIARQLQFLLYTTQHIEKGDFEENINILSRTVRDINSLLRRRTELKKR